MSSFLSKFKGFRKRGHAAHTIELINPPREWFVGLLLAATTFLFGALYLGYDFWEQYHMVDKQPSVNEGVVRYRQSDAQYYIDTFRKRDAVFQALRADVHVPQVVPSSTPTDDNEKESDENVPDNQAKPFAP